MSCVQDGKQVDYVACLLGTFQHMYTMEDAVKCMRAAEKALKPGGLFVVELSHPLSLFDGTIASSADFWDVELDDAQVEVRACSAMFPFHLLFLVFTMFRHQAQSEGMSS